MSRILVVEDDEFLQQIYTDILTQEGYSVTLAHDGNEGLAKIMEGGWNLVLLDLLLPNISGLEILRRLKTAPPKAPNGKIILSSNLDEGDEFKEALSMADGYIVKSNMSPEDLVNTIQKYLSS